MKAQGQIYVGITTSGRRHREFEAIMAKEPIDFAQVTYNVLDREVEARILPLARDRGIAVIANRPFRQGALIRLLERKPLPEWARETGAATWPQFLLKFIVSHPAITCAIPATSRVEHVRENMVAATGSCRTSRSARVWQPTSGRCDVSEWWTYTPSDLLLFSPRVYYRLIELHNIAVWPVHIGAALLGLLVRFIAGPRFRSARYRELGCDLGVGRVVHSLAPLRPDQLGGDLPRPGVRARRAALHLGRLRTGRFVVRPETNPAIRRGSSAPAHGSHRLPPDRPRRWPPLACRRAVRGGAGPDRSDDARHSGAVVGERSDAADGHSLSVVLHRRGDTVDDGIPDFVAAPLIALAAILVSVCTGRCLGIPAVCE